MNAKFFMGTLEVEHGESSNYVRYLVVANSFAAAQVVLEDLASDYLGEGAAGSVLAHQLVEVGYGTFLDLHEAMPVRYQASVSREEVLRTPVSLRKCVASIGAQLKARDITVSQSILLHAVAAGFGAKNWQVARTQWAEGRPHFPLDEKGQDARFSTLRPLLSADPASGHEPDLAAILTHYYCSHGIELKEAEAFALAYLKEWLKAEKALLGNQMVL